MERIDAVGLSFFGKGAIRQLPAELKKMGIRRALVVTDRFLYETGVAERVGRVLLEGNTEYAIYYQVQPNPTVQVVNECLMAARTLEVDILVAVGGGSAIDTAKAVSIVMANGGSVEDYEGTGKSARPGIPIVAVNTTAGTGSEVTSFYIVTDTEKHSKMAMVDTNCMVRIAINDIDFMMSMPPKLTASTGMDALTHALEAVLSVRATPLHGQGRSGPSGQFAKTCPKLFQTVVTGGQDHDGLRRVRRGNGIFQRGAWDGSCHGPRPGRTLQPASRRL
ncbi:MAG: iron-containing alcohol dehydrogenase [Hungatella hathewayi]